MKKSRVLQEIKIMFLKQSITRLFSINSSQVGIRPFLWAGQAPREPLGAEGPNGPRPNLSVSN